MSKNIVKSEKPVTIKDRERKSRSDQNSNTSRPAAPTMSKAWDPAALYF